MLLVASNTYTKLIQTQGLPYLEYHSEMQRNEINACMVINFLKKWVHLYNIFKISQIDKNDSS